jgi:hypothetical protein
VGNLFEIEESLKNLKTYSGPSWDLDLSIFVINISKIYLVTKSLERHAAHGTAPTTYWGEGDRDGCVYGSVAGERLDWFSLWFLVLSSVVIPPPPPPPPPPVPPPPPPTLLCQ